MIKVLLAFLLTIELYAGSIINQNIYEKENAVDIMFSFDAPYKGKIIQKKEPQKRTFILQDTTIKQKSTTKINSSIVQKLQVIPFEGKVFIQLTGEENFKVDASKTVDNYGLRLRVTPSATLLDIAPIKEPKFETKKEDDISTAYLKVLLILAGLLLFLYFFKKWLENRAGNLQGNWLFDQKEKKDNNKLKIIQQRPLDVKNRLALVSYHDKEYLLLLGTSNLLLDTFDTKDARTENDFDTLLSQNEAQLNRFVKEKHSKFDSYKEKLSNTQ